MEQVLDWILLQESPRICHWQNWQSRIEYAHWKTSQQKRLAVWWCQGIGFSVISTLIVTIFESYHKIQLRWYLHWFTVIFGAGTIMVPMENLRYMILDHFMRMMSLNLGWLNQIDLFGGVGHEFYEGYRTMIPEEKGFRSRVQLYKLFHLLNHWAHFGSSYKSSALSCLNKILDSWLIKIH